MESMSNKLFGLTANGCLSHNHTLEECRKFGIISPPVPLIWVLDHKTDELGKIKVDNSLKSQLADEWLYAVLSGISTEGCAMARLCKQSLDDAKRVFEAFITEWP